MVENSIFRTDSKARYNCLSDGNFDSRSEDVEKANEACKDNREACTLYANRSNSLFF